MTQGICENFYNYKVIEAEKKPKYFNVIGQIMNEYQLGKNTIYNIINGTRNISKCKVGLNLTIQKIKLPVRRLTVISY
tara:strand:+ start:942 stop:1175 length:234 start_codon:yes stop_codon:yes gene_type:complete